MDSKCSKTFLSFGNPRYLTPWVVTFLKCETTFDSHLILPMPYFGDLPSPDLPYNNIN